MIDTNISASAFNVLRYLAIEFTLGALLVPVIDQLIEYSAHQDIISGEGWTPTRQRLKTFRLFFNGGLVTSFSLILFIINGALEFGTDTYPQKKLIRGSVIQWSNRSRDPYSIPNSLHEEQFLITELSSKFVRPTGNETYFAVKIQPFVMSTKIYSASTGNFTVIDVRRVIDTYVTALPDAQENGVVQFLSPCKVGTTMWNKTYGSVYYESRWLVENTTNYTTTDISSHYQIIAFNISNHSLKTKCLEKSEESIYKDHVLCLTWMDNETVWAYYGGLRSNSESKYKWEHVIMSYIHEFKGFSIHVDEAVLNILSFHELPNYIPLWYSISKSNGNLRNCYSWKYEEKEVDGQSATGQYNSYLSPTPVPPSDDLNRSRKEAIKNFDQLHKGTIIRLDHIRNAALLLSKGIPTNSSEVLSYYIQTNKLTAGVSEWALYLWISTTVILIFVAIILRYLHKISPIKSSITSAYGLALMLQKTLDSFETCFDANRVLAMRIGLKKIGPNTVRLGCAFTKYEIVAYEGQRIRGDID